MKKLMLLMMLCGMMSSADSALAQNACSKEVDGRKVNFKVVNNTDKPFVINFVNHECKEGNSNTRIAPGGSSDVSGFNGHIFRVREVGTNKLLKEVAAAPATPSQITIGNAAANSPATKQPTVAAAAAAANTNKESLCTKHLSDKQITFEVLNATESAFTVNYVDDKCREGRSNQQTPSSQKYKGVAYEGHAFRVREVGTNKLLEVIVVSPSKTFTKVGNLTAQTVKIGPKPTMFELVKDRNPMQGFLKTANSVRKARNLPPMQFDNALNQACQYLTDAMTKHNKMGHNPAAFVGRGAPDYADYVKMNDPALRMQHYNFKGIPGVEAAGMVDTADVSEIGGAAILQWAMSTTHYRPFLSMDKQEFKYVGFAYTRVPNTDKYYTCAVFGNPK